MPTIVGLLLLLGGVATRYYPQEYGGPLYCGQSISTDKEWVAVDVGLYQSDLVRCGDLLEVRFSDGKILTARAMDSGYLAKYKVRVGGLLKDIQVDIPDHVWRRLYQNNWTSTGVDSVHNTTAGLRERMGTER